MYICYMKQQLHINKEYLTAFVAASVTYYELGSSFFVSQLNNLLFDINLNMDKAEITIIAVTDKGEEIFCNKIVVDEFSDLYKLTVEIENRCEHIKEFMI